MGVAISSSKVRLVSFLLLMAGAMVFSVTGIGGDHANEASLKAAFSSVPEDPEDDEEEADRV